MESKTNESGQVEANATGTAKVESSAKPAPKKPKPKNYSRKPTVEEMLIRCGGFSKVSAKAYIENLKPEENQRLADAAGEDGKIDIGKFTAARNAISERFLNQDKASLDD